MRLTGDEKRQAAVRKGARNYGVDIPTYTTTETASAATLSTWAPAADALIRALFVRR